MNSNMIEEYYFLIKLEILEVTRIMYQKQQIDKCQLIF